MSCSAEILLGSRTVGQGPASKPNRHQCPNFLTTAKSSACVYRYYFDDDGLMAPPLVRADLGHFGEFPAL